jgi:hypothetical protein
MATRRKRRKKTSGLGMVGIKGRLCRNRKGFFTKCKKPVARGTGKGFKKRHTRGIKGKCLKWSKGRTRCMSRAVGMYPSKVTSGRKHKVRRGKCLKWSKGRTRCIRREG